MKVVEIKLPAEEVKLAPVGDIQYGSQACDEWKLERHIQYGIDHDWWFLGMGDYLDHFSPSNRAALLKARVGTLYDSARELLDEAIEQRLDMLSYYLEAPGRWLGLLKGDHAWDFEDGEHSDSKLATMLGCAFLETAAIISIKVEGCPVPLKVFATHGAGTSINATGKTLHLERLVRSFDADIYLMGHSHLKYGAPLTRKEVVTYKGKSHIVSRTKIIGITGSWLDSYAKDTDSYVEEKALTPVETGGLLIQARPVKEEWGWRWDMFVSA